MSDDPWIPPEVWDAAVVPEPASTRVVPVALVFTGMCDCVTIRTRPRTPRIGRELYALVHGLSAVPLQSESALAERMLLVARVLAELEAR